MAQTILEWPGDRPNYVDLVLLVNHYYHCACSSRSALDKLCFSCSFPRLYKKIFGAFEKQLKYIVAIPCILCFCNIYLFTATSV